MSSHEPGDPVGDVVDPDDTSLKPDDVDPFINLEIPADRELIVKRRLTGRSKRVEVLVNPSDIVYWNGKRV